MGSEGNKFLSGNRTNVRSISFSVSNSITRRGDGGGSGLGILFTEVREEATAVTAIGNSDDGRVTKAFASEGCGWESFAPYPERWC